MTKNNFDKNKNEKNTYPLNLNEEWVVLHADIEKYERFSLLIKLTNLLVLIISFATQLPMMFVLLISGLIWLQDGIWKTFQFRMNERILVLENDINNTFIGSTEKPQFQFYSEWEKNPKSFSALISEYLRNSLRPTVAYPHVIIIMILLVVL